MAANNISKFFFDRRDYELLAIVNDLLSREDVHSLKRLLAPYMHPHGIKEMAATSGLRIAYAVIHLFRSLDRGKAADRLKSLRALNDEVLYASRSYLRKNTARVLIQIMKELVRTEDELTQLMLAHDFRQATTGKPRIINAQLEKYHLVEMPEGWNQIAFDDHVHDANTKGRKSATHLIMDAWIKGIRRLTVIHYNHILPEVAEELLEAASIMGIEVRVGIEFSVRHREKYVKLIWTPRGFKDFKEFLEFLNQLDMRALMDEGRVSSEYQQAYIFAALEEFNSRHRPKINEELDIELAPLPLDDFVKLVGTGQPSLHHLAKLIHDALTQLFVKRIEVLRATCTGGQEGFQTAQALVDRMNALNIEGIIDSYLRPACNPNLHNPFVPQKNDGAPILLTLSPEALVSRLEHIHAGFRITLNLSGLTVEDVLEILHDCRGSITHLEIFNFKDVALGRSTDNARIIDLQAAINSGNAVRLKKTIRRIIDELPKEEQDEADGRKNKLVQVLFHLNELQRAYRKTQLKSRIGTDSTGGSSRVPGMGLVITETLTPTGQKQLKRVASRAFKIPISIKIALRKTFHPTDFNDEGWVERFIRSIPGFSTFGREMKTDWLVTEYLPEEPEQSNIRTLGGIQEEDEHKLLLECRPAEEKKARPPLKYLNSHMRNTAKILLGFIPAFVTFVLTKDWWVLAYLGAFIWFGITGLRNVIQSVLGAGGIQRSPLLRWNDYMSWDRLADSLLYTGFSVPLLDYLVKTLLLDRGLGITTSSSPIILYSVMALFNGLYLTSHNLFRGLPRAAAFGNLFRSVFSIPLAIFFNGALVMVLIQAGVPSPETVLQKWAAIISKFASDIVAACIEGLADRRENIRMRSWDYEGKLKQTYETYTQLELLHPEEDVLKVLETPKQLICTLSAEGGDFDNIVIINALDLMYFWMYQPRARYVLQRFIREMTTEERTVFLLSQYVLQREREIGQLFLDGLVGRNFSKALAFYLDQNQNYLDDIHKLAIKYAPAVRNLPPRSIV